MKIAFEVNLFVVYYISVIITFLKYILFDAYFSKFNMKDVFIMFHFWNISLIKFIRNSTSFSCLN